LRDRGRWAAGQVLSVPSCAKASKIGTGSVTRQALFLVVWPRSSLVFAPILTLGIPLAAKLLDRFDREQRFTVGYHVTAIRKGPSDS
jgi:hypothetical protein